MDAERQGDFRVSDADRDQVVELLKERTADGTLTLDEFTGRVERALAARTRSELDATLAGLQAPATSVAPASRRAPRHSLVAIMGGAETKGRWRCGSHVTAVAVMGGCKLDFLGAEIDVAEVHVTAVAVMGGIDIVVPEGVEVHMDGLPIMGGRGVRVKDVPVLPGTPRIVVHAFPVMGGVTVRSKAPKTPVRALPEPTAVISPPPAPPEDGTATIMFADVCDYSGINERLGDVRAHELLREYTDIIRRNVSEHGGREVKSSGDGVMVAFTSASRAFRCAVAVQRSLDERNRSGAVESIRAHIGVHTGDVVRDGDDFLGSTVIVASRLADAAGPDEILTSAVARDLADGSREFGFVGPREVTLKGLADARQVYSVRWQPATDAAPYPRTPGTETDAPPDRADSNAASSTTAVANDSPNGRVQPPPPPITDDTSSTITR